MVATGILIALAVVGLALIALGAISPFFLVAVVIFFALPFVLGLVGVASRHAQPTVGSGPQTPSTSDAAYDPVETPRQG